MVDGGFAAAILRNPGEALCRGTDRDRRGGVVSRRSNRARKAGRATRHHTTSAAGDLQPETAGALCGYAGVGAAVAGQFPFQDGREVGRQPALAAAAECISKGTRTSAVERRDFYELHQ